MLDRIHSGGNICALSVDARGVMVVYFPFSDFIPCGWLHAIFHHPCTLYAIYGSERFYVLAIFVKALFIAFSHANGVVQVITIFAVECMVLASLSALTRPYFSGISNA